MSRRIKYCWDTSVFVAWLKEESSAPLADMNLVVGDIDSGKAVLVVSVTTATEMLETKHTPEQWERFQKCLNRSNVILADITLAIAELASRIRADAQTQGRRLQTPDAQIIATAITYRVDALHSLDPHMLGLNGSPIVNGMRITQPLLLDGQQGLVGLVE
ncbi:MAG: PIN domain-containing protein [Planctomycetia bacterium]|nr:PIN domain-containing protein [Planctomycetia bacterium]